MLFVYCAASLILALLVCWVAGRTRPWIVQVAFAGLTVGSLATASKIVPVHPEWLPDYNVSVAVGLFSMTFLLTDYLSEVNGKKEAMKAVWMGLISQLLFVFAAVFALSVPAAAFWQDQAAFERVLGVAPRIFVASVLAYVTAQFADVAIYHWILERTSGRHLWLRNNVGTFLSQTIDSVIFYLVAFYGVIPNIVELIIVTCVVKYVIALVDTPFIYAATHLAGAGAHRKGGYNGRAKKMVDQ